MKMTKVVIAKEGEFNLKCLFLYSVMDTEGVMNPHVAKENKFNVMCVLFSRYKCFFSYSHNLLNAHHSILFQLIKNDPLKLLHEND